MHDIRPVFKPFDQGLLAQMMIMIMITITIMIISLGRSLCRFGMGLKKPGRIRHQSGLSASFYITPFPLWEPCIVNRDGGFHSFIHSFILVRAPMVKSGLERLGILPVFNRRDGVRFQNITRPRMDVYTYICLAESKAPSSRLM